MLSSILIIIAAILIIVMALRDGKAFFGDWIKGLLFVIVILAAILSGFALRVGK